HGLIEVQQEDVAVRVHFCAVDVHFGSFVAVDVTDTYVHPTVVVQTVARSQYPGLVDDAAGAHEPAEFSATVVVDLGAPRGRIDGVPADDERSGVRGGRGSESAAGDR